MHSHLRVHKSHQYAVAVRDRYEVHPSPLRRPNEQLSVVIACGARLWGQQRLHRHAAPSSLPNTFQRKASDVTLQQTIYSDEADWFRFPRIVSCCTAFVWGGCGKKPATGVQGTNLRNRILPAVFRLGCLKKTCCSKPSPHTSMDGALFSLTDSRQEPPNTKLVHTLS